ncbi:MAG TPA: cobaltochelatase subunit CobN [Blastocatellia bacterium]|nr:cobaltochelatase subunit CobN [Blastocatellia bacterium]
MKITVFYVGTSLLAALKRAEDEINARHKVALEVATYNCGAPLSEAQWRAVNSDLGASDIVFIIHVTDGENAARINNALELHSRHHNAVIAFNCMPDLMRRTRLGKLDFSGLMKSRKSAEAGARETSASGFAQKLSSWMSDFMKTSRSTDNRIFAKRSGLPGNADSYLKLIRRLPAVLKFVPSAGKLRDIKNYILLFGYFLQPTPSNIRSMLLLAIKQYAPGDRKAIVIDPPEEMPLVGIYHPEADGLFETYEAYQEWHREKRGAPPDPIRTIGLLLMRPQIISDSRRHYDGLIRAIEEAGLDVIPAISTFMDNRDACLKFFVDHQQPGRASNKKKSDRRNRDDIGEDSKDVTNSPDSNWKSRVSQVVSLTGFSFVGGPAMNDSQAAADFLSRLNVPFRSMVSLDVQTIEHWKQNKLGLNPIQTAMQIAIPEIDGGTEPFVYGGLPAAGNQPEPLEERCRRIARRLARWNRMRTAPRSDLRLALLVFCFPPDKGNIGTAADLDVFPSLFEILSRLRSNGYQVDLPVTAEELRERLLKGNSDDTGTLTNVAYRMSADEYRLLCPYVGDVEAEWGQAPGTINSNGREILVLGHRFGNVFVGVQPTFGYEGDPMRLLAAESGAPHHGFMGLYTYLERIFQADAVVHVGTHGSLEFMPGKQVGLSEKCWPDRLIGELPNIYIYSVNNPSEGTIAKRRSYAELVSYLTPPIENAGLYKEFASMKDLLSSYRAAGEEVERQRLFEAIEEKARQLNL